MNQLLRAILVASVLLLHPSVTSAIDRSECKQYGGTTDCWMPVIGMWDHDACGEIGTFTSYSIAECQAQGGTWGGASGCLGVPEELRRPTSEGDIVPYIKDVFSNFYGPLCAGPDASPYVWGVPIFSINCFTGSGAVFTLGYESFNNTGPITVTGRRLSSGVCSTSDTTLNFSALRRRLVSCPGFDGSTIQTFGGTPALCSLHANAPINPKQCESCGEKSASPVYAGNPIDLITGSKRQLEVDYAGTGPQALRFERVYHNRAFTIDGTQWRHNYSARVEHHAFGTRPVALAHRPRGRVFQFAWNGSQYSADSDIDDRLVPVTDSGGAITGWQYYEAASDSTETYDAQGKLVSIADRAGLTRTLEYSTAATPVSIASQPGLLIRVADAFGRQLSFTYDTVGRMTSMTDPAGQQYVYAYYSKTQVTTMTFPGDLVSTVAYPDGKVRTYLYNESALNANFVPGGRLTGIVDENNSRFGSYSYAQSGVAFRSSLAGNVGTVTINSNAWPSSISVTDALGTVRTYGYQLVNGQYLNSTVAQPAVSGTGTVTSATTYDANGNVATRRDFNGNRTNFTYDLARNLETSRTEGLTAAGAVTPQTRTISTQWHGTFRLPTGVAEPLRITTNVYDPDGTQCGARGALCSRTVRATTDADGSQAFSATPSGTPRTWTYTYNANGSMLTMNGPRTDVADVTTYSYYVNDDPEAGKRGNLASVTNAAGHVTSITSYNLHGQPTTIVDPNGLTTTLGYDLRLRLTSRTVGSETTSYDYDGVGQLTKVTLPDGSYLAYTYDAAHRLTEIADNLGNRIAYTLDAMGNRTAEQVRDPANALAQTRSRVFNNLNRLFQELGAAAQVTEYAYDNQGNVTSVKDPLNKVTANAYDALNRLRQVTDPALGVTQYAYNGLDALIQVTDPRNLVTGYTVDGLGNLTLQQSPDTGNTSNTYDPAGNLLTQTDAKGQTTSYAYDVLGRVTLITFHDGSKQTYAYDSGTNALGRLSSITETNPANQVTSVIAYGYDAHGRVTSETRTVNAVQYVLAHRYDSAGRLDQLSYPSGRTVNYAFDALGRVSAVTTTKAGGQPQAVVSSVTYHPFGGVTGYTLGNGQVYSRSLDLDGRIASYTLGAQSFGIGYDAASRIEFISEVGVPANSNTYGYDSLDRLTSAALPGSTYGYSYDAGGNRLTRSTGSSTDSYAYGPASNRLASITPTSGPVRSFTFDANGSTTADGNNAYAYDVRGRMVQAVSSLGTTSYQVNALGQRIRKTNSLGDRVFHYDTRGRLIAETDPGGGLKRELIYLGDIPVAVIQ